MSTMYALGRRKSVLAVVVGFGFLAFGWVLATRNASSETQALYLLSGTQDPSGFTGHDLGPVVLYKIKSAAALDIIREVMPATDVLNVVHTAGDTFFFAHRNSDQASIAIVHTRAPSESDGLVCNRAGMRLLPNEAAAAEYPAGSFDILLPFIGGNAPQMTHALGVVSTVYGSAQTRLRWDAWDEYATLRYDGTTAGPPLIDSFLGRSAGDKISVAVIFGNLIVDTLPPDLRGVNAPRGIDIVAASGEYFVIHVGQRWLTVPALAKQNEFETLLFVHDRLHEKWTTLQLQGDGTSSRLFGDWLTSVARVWNFDHKQEINPSTVSGADNAFLKLYGSGGKTPLFLLPGVLMLDNLADGRRITIQTGQANSEVLWAGSNEVLYRVNDRIFNAKIVGNKLQEPSVVVKGEQVPEIHWVFWGPAQ